MNSKETKKTTIEAETAVKIEEERRIDKSDDKPKSGESSEKSTVININEMLGDIKGKKLKVKYQDQSSVSNSTVNNYNFYDARDIARDIMGYISSVQKDESAPTVTANVRQYKLYERQDCIDFVSEYKRSLHLVYAIALSMFEYIPVGDLQKLATNLLERLEKEYDEKGNEITTHISSFISLDTVLNIIGAQPCKVSFTSQFEDITERCIRFEDSREKILENLWELFPMMRNAITSWLIDTDFTYSYRNAFSTKCLVTAIANVVKMDFGDSINRLFTQLTSKIENKYLIVRLMMTLIEEEDVKKNICEILRRWANSPKWLWEVSLVVYSLSNEELPFADELGKMLTAKIRDSYNENWGEWNIYFIGGQMVNSLRLRNLVSSVLQKLTVEAARNKNEYLVAVIYLLIISNAYQFVDKEDVALPLVTVDNKKQIEDIEILLHKSFSDYALRHGLFEVLEAYLEEIDEYGAGERLLNQLKSYFYIIAKKSDRFNGDVQRFLSRLRAQDNKTAKIILAFIQEKLSSNKELIKV